jgi:hypothetical protein
MNIFKKIWLLNDKCFLTAYCFILLFFVIIPTTCILYFGYLIHVLVDGFCGIRDIIIFTLFTLVMPLIVGLILGIRNDLKKIK